MTRAELKPGTKFVYNIDKAVKCWVPVPNTPTPPGYSASIAPIDEYEVTLIGPDGALYLPQPPLTKVNTARYLPADAASRKALPMASGVLDYFPDALAAVAEVSRVGNEQHNPGQPLHWAQEKSTDFADTIVRHLVERGTLDTDGLRHSAKVAWRALALLQMELQNELGLSKPRGATCPNQCPDSKSDPKPASKEVDPNDIKF